MCPLHLETLGISNVVILLVALTFYYYVSITILLLHGGISLAVMCGVVTLEVIGGELLMK